MRRDEMIDYIKSELQEFVERYNQAEGYPKRQEHRIRSAADGILAMMEGFGMAPPEVKVLNLYDNSEHYIPAWEEE